MMDLEPSDQPNKRLKTGAVKHRSSKACQTCRSRKVRCDVLTNGPRCTNCRLDNLECVVLASKRGRNKQLRPDNASEAILVNQLHAAASQGQATQDKVITSTGSHADNGVIPAVVTFDEDLESTREERQSFREDEDRRETAHVYPQTYDGLLTPEIPANTSEQSHSPTGIASLPAFIAPVSNRVLSEDIQYLTLKGVFLVPEPDLQLEILRGYLFSVHPFLPVLDCQEFISAVVSNGEQGRVSLLLFQAVMFAGLHSLQPSIINRLGFETTKQAREVFFTRVRLLYDFDVEPNSIAVFQSLLLMSSWYSKWHERRHTWHWTGLAYDIARSMGLHREPISNFTSDKTSYFRRRLWWSLYIRDRMIALGTRRPMRIRDDEFDVKMLTLNDFNIPDLDAPNERLGSIFPSTEEMTSAARMCIQLAKLGTIIGHVVSSQYTTSNTQSDIPYTMMVVSRRDEGALAELEICNKELEDWYQSLREHIPRPEVPPSARDPLSCAEVHWAILQLTHLTTVNVLHRARALHPPPALSDRQVAPKSSRLKVKESARGMTKLTQSMLQNDQARFLGLIGVTAVIAACLSHMLDISSSDEDVRDASTFRLHQSVQVLQYLRGIYASADAAASFVASLTGHVGNLSATSLVSSSGALDHIKSNKSASPSTTFGQSPTLHSLGASSANKKGSSQACPNVGPSRPTSSPHTPHWGVQRGLGEIERRDHRIFPKDYSVRALPRSRNSASGRRQSPPPPSQSTQDTFQIDTTFGGPMNSADPFAAFDLSSNAEGVDLNFMPFNYDFYTDAFGFLDPYNKESQPS